MHEEIQLTVHRFIRSMDSAEANIVGLMARERQALRSGNILAARQIHSRLGKAARSYLSTVCSARNTLSNMDDLFSEAEVADFLEQRRVTFSDLMRVEMAALTAARLVSEGSPQKISRVA